MQLFFREKGDASLPPLIILHGLWGASDNWLGVAGLLSDRFHVFLPDCRNHGNSPHAPRHDYAALSEDLSDFIQQLELPVKPFIAGHSMGGKTLMYLLLKKPEIAAKAAIIDIWPHSRIPSWHKDIIKGIPVFPLNSLKDRKELKTAVLRAFPKPEQQQLILKNIRKTPEGFEWRINPEAIRKNLGALAGWPADGDTLPCLLSILFIRGENSNYIPPSLPKAIFHDFPSASLISIPKASHCIHAEQPEALANILSKFFLTG